MNDGFLLLCITQRGHTGHSLYTSDAGGNTGLGNNLEHADVAGSLDVSTAAELTAGTNV